MKIIHKLQKTIADKKSFFSFEFFPPKTEDGLRNLYDRLNRMVNLEPAFIDITWGAAGSTSDLSLEISTTAQHYFGVDVMMHLTCTNMPREKIDEALERAHKAGIDNILALRGDPPAGTKEWRQCENGFKYASDLVEYIRRKYKDYFGICVAGYPEGHLESKDRETDIRHLKNKVDAGADFIITQLFYDFEEYKSFFKRCREIGITCPVIPGLLPIQNYDSFLKFTDLSKTKVPPEIMQSLEPIKSNDEEVKSYGISLCADMCRFLMGNGAPGFHFYTLNLERSVTMILEKIGLVTDAVSRRALPWRPCTHPHRRREDVRPIFWSNRPKSYLARTMEWDDFPNGRWGDSRSPAFGNLHEYYLIQRGLIMRAKEDNRKQEWGECPRKPEDVFEVFASFCEGKIKRLPWTEGVIQKETFLIVNELVAMNRNGFLTINSQPQVNGAPSSDPAVGWGGPNGYVYQKAYVEFFVAPEKLHKFVELTKRFPTLTYHATNVRGESHGNTDSQYVNAVTWGVFRGKEIIQPTIVDTVSFMRWKDEAFQLWLDEWAILYEAGSVARKLIEEIHDNYYLVNLVENDYIGGNIFRIFMDLIDNAATVAQE